MKYVCVAPSKELFNIKGESLGMSGERALYYSESVGEHRVYRQAYPIKPYYWEFKNLNEDMILFEFDSKEEAQKLCDEINEAYGDNFIVKEVNDGENQENNI